MNNLDTGIFLPQGLSTTHIRPLAHKDRLYKTHIRPLAHKDRLYKTHIRPQATEHNRSSGE